MSRRPNCLGFKQAVEGLFAITRFCCVSRFVTSVPNRRFGPLHHMPHLALSYDNALASLDLELSLVVHHQRLCQSLFDEYLRGQRSPSQSLTAYSTRIPVSHSYTLRHARNYLINSQCLRVNSLE